MSADLGYRAEEPGAARASAEQALTVRMSLAVLADDPPAPGRPPAPRSAPRSAPASHRRATLLGAWTSLGTAAGWPLGVILVLQAALSLRLTWSDSASVGEANALWVGRLELGHWLHGAALAGAPALSGQPSAVASYLSGAPSLYPPIGALASGLGGLAAARLLSLGLMLGATVALHGVTRRLSDRRSAFFGAALFAGLAGTAFLGALASNEAMSLGLLALAAWLGIRAANRSGRVQAALAVAVGAALALANATAYGSGPDDLIVLSVTALAIWRGAGRAAAWRGAALESATLGIALGAGLLAGGRADWPDAMATMAGRAPAGAPLGLAAAGGKWLGAVAVLAALGALVTVAARPDWQVTAMSTILIAPVLIAPVLAAPVLAAPVLAAPLAAARHLSATSLLSQGPGGAWFACVVAGYAVASLARAVPRAKSVAAFGAGLGLVTLAAVPGIPWAAQQFGWPQAGPLTAAMRTVLARHDGPVLSDGGGDLLGYYLGQDVAGRLIVGTRRFTYNDPSAGGPRAGLAAYQEAIRRHYFGVIMLSLGPAAQANRLERTVVLAGYRRVAALPFAAPGPGPGPVPGSSTGRSASPGSAAGAGRDTGQSWNIWVRAGRP